MNPSYPVTAWREVLAERTAEACEELLGLDGVVDVVVGGSIGRGEPWPLSDIDILPIAGVSIDALREPVLAVRQRLERAWARTGIPQNLDVGTLGFDIDDVTDVIGGGEHRLADRVTSPRWLFGSDKAAGGEGSSASSIGTHFGQLMVELRFTAKVQQSRFDAWMHLTGTRLERARIQLSEPRDADCHRVDDRPNDGSRVVPDRRRTCPRRSRRDGSRSMVRNRRRAGMRFRGDGFAPVSASS